MTATFQTNLTDTTYNGWTNYETWNVALWIGNDQGLYQLAGAAGSYEDFVDALEGCDLNDLSTPDGVNYRDPKVNTVEINSDCYFGVWYLAAGQFLTLCPKSAKIRDNTETAVVAVCCYYARGAMPYIKTLNYPNLQRWQFASDI